jgi:hypothetical protein
VCSFQGKPGEVVIEIFPAESDQLEISPVMITVTGDAVLSLDFCGRMKSLILVDTGFQFSMTSQAFIIRYFFSQDMAAGAIRHPLEMGMCLGQFTRRELCHSRDKRNQDERKQSKELFPYHNVSGSFVF